MSDIDERIAALREALEKATEGPWCWEQTGEKSNSFIVGTACDEHGNMAAGRVQTKLYDEGSMEFVGTLFEHVGILANEGATVNYGDAEFVCAARNELPAVLDELERLQQVEHLVWHAMEASEKRGPDHPPDAGEVVIPMASLAELFALLPEAHPQHESVHHTTGRIAELERKLRLHREVAGSSNDAVTDAEGRIVELEAENERLQGAFRASERLLKEQVHKLAAIKRLCEQHKVTSPTSPSSCYPAHALAGEVLAILEGSNG